MQASISFLKKILYDITKAKNLVVLVGEIVGVIIVTLRFIKTGIPDKLKWLYNPIVFLLIGLVIFSICQIIIKSKLPSSINKELYVYKYEPRERKIARIIRTTTLAICACFFLINFFLTESKSKPDLQTDTGIIITKFQDRDIVDEFSNSLYLSLSEDLRDGKLDSVLVKQNGVFLLPSMVNNDTIKNKFEYSKFKRGIFTCGEFYNQTNSLNCVIFIHKLPLVISVEASLKSPQSLILKTPDIVKAQIQAEYVSEFIVAILLQRLNRFKESNALLEKFLQKGLNPDFTTNCLLLMGNNCAAQKDYTKAVELFSRGLTINPDHAVIKYNLGLSLLGIKNFSGAKAIFNELGDSLMMSLLEEKQLPSFSDSTKESAVQNIDTFTRHIIEGAARDKTPNSLRFPINNGWVELDTGLILRAKAPTDVIYELANYIQPRRHTAPGIVFEGLRDKGKLLLKLNQYNKETIDTIKVWLFSGFELRSFAEVIIYRPPAGELTIDLPITSFMSSKYCDSIIFPEGVIPSKIVLYITIMYNKNTDLKSHDTYFLME